MKTTVYAKKGLDLAVAHAAIAGEWVPSLKGISVALIEAEKRIALLPKADRTGAIFTFMSAGPSSASYRWPVNGVCVVAKRTTRGICIHSIEREKRYAKQRGGVAIHLTDEQTVDLADRAVRAACIAA